MERGRINVLLIGDNLLAKKTFVNSFAYYLKFSRIEEAMERPDLIRRHFEPSSVKFGESLRIKYRPSSKKVINEYKVDGIAEDIRLIDLPTFGNVTADEDNVKRSMEFLRNYKWIHGVYVFPRMWQFPSVQFKYLLNFLMIHFEKTLFEKMYLIINKSSRNLQPDIVTIVRAEINTFTERRIRILDDEAFNYLLAFYKGGNAGREAILRKLQSAEAWVLSSIYANSLLRDLTKQHGTPAYEIGRTVFLNRIRYEIPQMIKRMADLRNAIEHNETVLKFARVKNNCQLDNLNNKQLQYRQHYEQYFKAFALVGNYLRANSLAQYNSAFLEYLHYRQTRANQKIKHAGEITKRFNDDKRVIQLVLQFSAGAECSPTMEDISRSLDAIYAQNNQK